MLTYEDIGKNLVYHVSQRAAGRFEVCSLANQKYYLEVTSMNMQLLEKTATEMKANLGGRIFAFPVEADNPYSTYAVAVFDGTTCRVYTRSFSVEEAAGAALAALECFKSSGIPASYEEDVRFVSYDAQVNGPSIGMRRLKKANQAKPFLEAGVGLFGLHKSDGSKEETISPLGVLKLSYLQMVEASNPKCKEVMEGYYRLLASKRYGKTVAAIRQEVRRMTKDQARGWLEETYAKYVQDSFEVFNLIPGGSPV